MNILYLSPVSLPSNSAITVQETHMCESLSKASHKVTFFCDRADDFENIKRIYGLEEEFELVEAKILDFKKFRQLHFAWKVHRYLTRELDVDLVYSRHVYSLLSCLNVDVPVVYEAHTSFKNLPERWVFRLAVNRCSNFTLVTISQALMDWYLDQVESLEEDQVIVAHDSAKLVTGTNPEESAIKNKDSSVNCGYVGSLLQGKGMGMIAQIAERLKGINFHIVGGEGEKLDKWKAKVGDFPNIYFYGHVPHARVGNYIRHFDIVLAPLQKEIIVNSGQNIARWTSPLKIFEYMAHGKAIVASDLPVLREILTSGRNALLVDPDNVEEWVRTLKELSNDEPLRARLGKRAKKDFETNHTWDSRVNRIMTKISSIMEVNSTY